MYFPYLRGRQFELIALRELVEKGVLSSRITPIIEPVKLSSTLTDKYIYTSFFVARFVSEVRYSLVED